MAEKAQKTHTCCFDARLLWALEPFVAHHRETFSGRLWNGNIFIEPAQGGGAFVGAVHGHAMAVFHDPDARCREPLTLDIPEEAFAACAPKEPLIMSYCGTQYAAEMPEWMQPGVVVATSSGMFVGPRMRHPAWAEEDREFYPVLFNIIAMPGVHRLGHDYRLTAGRPADWRKVLRKVASDATQPADGTRIFMPQIANLFSRIVDLCIREAPEEKQPRVFHRRTAETKNPGAIIITIENRPDFVGCYMPMLEGKPQPVSWHFLKEVKSDD